MRRSDPFWSQDGKYEPEELADMGSGVEGHAHRAPEVGAGDWQPSPGLEPGQLVRAGVEPGLPLPANYELCTATIDNNSKLLVDLIEALKGMRQ